MKIGLIGRVAVGSQLIDGQTIKTKILLSELKNNYSDSEYFIVDSHNSKKKIYSYIINVMRCIKKCDVIFILLSSNGIKVTFPIVYLINKIYKKPIIHDVIGGRLDEVAKENRIILKSIKSFYINLVESKELENKLKKIGIKNVEVVPNFKRIECVNKNSITKNESMPFKFCTFSRVSRSKGIGEAIKAIKQINFEAGFRKVTLDIYGPIEEAYKEEFLTMLSDDYQAINYNGCVDYDKSVDILKDYSALLFPTTFFGEGFPGTVIDAFSAALPVIATDWHCNPEIINDYETGLLYNYDKPEMLVEKIKEYIQFPEEIYKMKCNCIKEAMKYDADIIMKKITDIVNESTKKNSILINARSNK